MHDIRFIRDHSDDFDQALARRGLAPMASTILDVDSKRREVQTTLQELQQKRNETSRQIGEIKKAGGDADAIMAEVAAIKDQMGQLEEEEKALGEALDAHLLGYLICLMPLCHKALMKVTMLKCAHMAKRWHLL